MTLQRFALWMRGLTLKSFELQIFREMNTFLYGRTFSSYILGFVVYLNAAFAKERKKRTWKLCFDSYNARGFRFALNIARV
jgi:hypothetical protein